MTSILDAQDVVTAAANVEAGYAAALALPEVERRRVVALLRRGAYKAARIAEKLEANTPPPTLEEVEVE